MAFTGRIGHVEGIESPWGNAGGVVKSVEDVERMALTGVGWIEAGSYTLEPRKGNKWDAATASYLYQFDYHHDPETGETYNSLGMPNKGMDAVETEIPEMARIARAHNKPLLVNVAPVTDAPAEESLELVSRAYAAGADGVILNAGCPNVKKADGMPHGILSRSPVEFGKVLRHLWDAKLPKPIMTRISPQETFGNFNVTARYMARLGIVSAVFNPNTFVVPMPVDDEGKPLLDVPMTQVGKSGPAMATQAGIEQAWAQLAFGDTAIDIVSSSSITSATELQKRLDAGAVAGAGTTFFYESASWKESVDRLLSDLAT